MTLILTVILVALIFEYINGFHDTANSIATVVSTKVLTPREAIVLAAITNEISELLVKTFVTALEREDIEALSNVLYKVPKTIEKFAERYILCAPRLREVKFNTQLDMLEDAVNTVVAMLKELKKNDLTAISQHNSKLQKLEGNADKLMLDELRDLYSGKHDALTAMALKDLYELLEKVFDRCRDAGNVISHVVLKHS